MLGVLRDVESGMVMRGLLLGVGGVSIIDSLLAVAVCSRSHSIDVEGSQLNDTKSSGLYFSCSDILLLAITLT